MLVIAYVQQTLSGEKMLSLKADEQKLIIDLKYTAGKSLAETAVQTVYLYACTTEEDKAIVSQLGRMVLGLEPMVDVDLMDYTDKESLEGCQ